MGLGSVDCTVSCTTTQFRRGKADRHPIRGGGWAPRPHLQKPDAGWVWSAGHSGLTPCSKTGIVSIKGILSALVQNITLWKWGNESMSPAVLCWSNSFFKKAFLSITHQTGLSVHCKLLSSRRQEHLNCHPTQQSPNHTDFQVITI